MTETPAWRSEAARIARGAANRIAPAPADPWPFTRTVGPERLAAANQPATDILIGRLTEELRGQIAQASAADPALAPLVGHLENPDSRDRLLLQFGMHLELEPVVSATGLVLGQPSEEIHSMARGPLTAAGGLYEADLVIDALLRAGADLSQITHGLDFGCSSGRVLRVLSAAYPDVSWSGCDPNGPAIAWAGAHIPGVTFFDNGNEPPLAMADGAVQFAYGISIWSHFEPALGLRWFEEMRRVIAPGGYLVFTTHGPTSIDYYGRVGERADWQLREIREALYTDSWWYAAEFGETGDWGVVNPAWGTAFLSPEWVLAELTPDWRVLDFGAGRNQDNQDLYVLQRR